jgi:hypothetical protein
MKAKHVVVVVCQLVGLVTEPMQTALAQNLPTADQFDGALRTCAAGQKVPFNADLILAVSSKYRDQWGKDLSSFGNSTDFLKLISEGDRLEGYRLYVDCITNILSSTSIVTPPPITVTYRVCSGEYERACQTHDTYLYCYSDVGAWARARCTSWTVQRLNTYGGNKCGYSIDAVICTGPK